MIDIRHVTIILGFALSINNFLFSQAVKISNFQNFFGLKEDFEFEGQMQFEKIAFDSQIVAFRRYNNENFTVVEEYLHYKNDTFLLLEYSNLDHHISSSGKVVPSICCKSIDTTFTFNPETYEEEILINKYWDWSKEGMWKIDNPDFYEFGNYKNNIKVGEWYNWDKKNNFGKYIYFDTEGAKLYEEPQNLIQTQNRERIIKELIGVWKIEENNGWKLRLLKEAVPSNVGTYGNLVFDSEYVKYIIRLRCATGFDFENFKKRNKNNWILEGDNLLSLNVYSFENKKFKITYLSRYELFLTLIK